MVAKELVLLLLFISVFASGCLSPEDRELESENILEETGIPEDTGTQEETGTPEEIVTPGEAETPEEAETSDTGEGPEEEGTEAGLEEGEGEAGVEQVPEFEARTHLIRLQYYLFIPSSLEINRGDLVVWRNSQEPKALFVLRSEEGLFEDERLGYGNTLRYTFNETGSYNFSVAGYPKMTMTITVK